MKKIIILFLILFSGTLWASKAFILGGSNRIKRKNSISEDFLLIEKKSFPVNNGDIIKTKSKGYILIRNKEFQLIIAPFSRLVILDKRNNRFKLSYGKVWLETKTRVRNLIIAGQNRSMQIQGLSVISYKPAEEEKPELLNIQGILGHNSAIAGGARYNIYQYGSLNYNSTKGGKYSLVPLLQVQKHVENFQRFQGMVSGWKNRELAKKKFLFKPGGKISYLTVGEQKYLALAFQPRFKYKEWQWGLIIPAYVDYGNSEGYKPSQWGNYNEWDFDGFTDGIGDLVLKIDYLTYGVRYKSPLFVNAGNLDRIRLKNNLVLNDFKPNLNYPQRRQLSLETVYAEKTWGVEGFVGDFSSAEILGFRGYYKPFYKHFLFKRAELGFTAITDFDAKAKSKGVGDTSIYAFGLDMNIPIYNLFEALTFNFSTEYSTIFYNNTDNAFSKARGYGLSYGLSGKIFDAIDYRFGGIILKDEFPDSYFDAFYLSRRKEKLDTLLSNRDDNNYGLFGSFVFDFEGLFRIDLSYREVLENKIINGIPDNQFSFYFYLYPELMDFAYIVFSYSRLGIQSFSSFWNKFFSSELSAINASLRLPFKLKYMELQLNFRRSVNINEELGEVKTENSYESQIKIIF